MSSERENFIRWPTLDFEIKAADAFKMTGMTYSEEAIAKACTKRVVVTLSA